VHLPPDNAVVALAAWLARIVWALSEHDRA
jgi:hypothetical protein